MEGNEVIWGDDEEGLLDAQFALQDAEIMAPDDEAGSSACSEQAGSEQAAMISKYQNASSHAEAIAVESSTKKALAKMARSSGSKPPYIPKDRVCRFCGEKGHYGKTCRQNPDVPPRPVKHRKCFKCGERGHYATQCKAAPLRKCALCDKAEILMGVCSGLLSGCVTTCNHLKNQPHTFTCSTCSGCIAFSCGDKHVYQSLCRTCCVKNGVDFKV
jgi:hypothetical protein